MSSLVTLLLLFSTSVLVHQQLCHQSRRRLMSAGASASCSPAHPTASCCSLTQVDCYIVVVQESYCHCRARISTLTKSPHVLLIHPLCGCRLLGTMTMAATFVVAVVVVLVVVLVVMLVVLLVVVLLLCWCRCHSCRHHPCLLCRGSRCCCRRRHSRIANA
jgi:hypothetical protein